MAMGLQARPPSAMAKIVTMTASALGFAAALAALPARADYPEKPVRAIVPFVAGSSNDILARMVSPLMTKAMGQQVIIMNMPGADGRIGIEALAKSAPDGYSILYSGGAIALIPALRKHVPFDPDRDVQPVAELGAGPYVVAINPRLPVKNLLELAEHARRNPGKLNGSAGGNSTFMALVLFQIVTNSKVEVISYKGTGPAATAVVAGEVDFASMDGSAFVSFIPGGKVKPLAVAGTRRLASLPDVPTTREAGLPEFVAGTAFGVYTKGGTPMPIVQRLNAEINKAIATPEVTRHLISIGLDPSSTSVEEYTQQYRRDLARWKDVVTRAKLPLQD